MKKLKLVVAFILATVMLFSMTACVNDVEQFDDTKTQLDVGNYPGGFGEEWTDELAARFEEKYKDFSFEDGKVGIQVWVNHDKNSNVASEMADLIATSDNEVFFTSGQNFYEFTTRNLILDITDMVTENLSSKYPEETKSIADKLPEELLPYSKASDGKYYALPTFDGAQGIVYDKDLFAEKKLYIAKNGAPSEALQEGGSFAGDASNYQTYTWVNGTDKNNLCAGPDGKYGTMDDGLAATYEEFFALCANMRQKNVKAFTWTGQYIENYSLMLYKYAVTDYLGKDEAALKYNAGTIDGKNTTEVVKFDGNGDPLIDANGNIQTETITISTDNYGELAKQTGRYYAFKLWEEIIKNGDFTMTSVNKSQSHVMAQADYIESRFTDKPIAFILEGPWWENEAKVSGGTQSVVDNQGEEADPANRNFGFYPLPKATSAQIGEPTTLYKTASSAFINANIKENKKLAAKMFLQYAFTDESLNYMTYYTGMRGAANYELTEETLNHVTPFQKDMLLFDEQAEACYAVVPSLDIYYEIQEKLYVLSRASAKINGLEKTAFFYPMLNENISAKEYFKGQYTKINSVE